MLFIAVFRGFSYANGLIFGFFFYHQSCALLCTPDVSKTARFFDIFCCRSDDRLTTSPLEPRVAETLSSTKMYRCTARKSSKSFVRFAAPCNRARVRTIRFFRRLINAVWLSQNSGPNRGRYSVKLTTEWSLTGSFFDSKCNFYRPRKIPRTRDRDPKRVTPSRWNKMLLFLKNIASYVTFAAFARRR